VSDVIDLISDDDEEPSVWDESVQNNDTIEDIIAGDDVPLDLIPTTSNPDPPSGHVAPSRDDEIQSVALQIQRELIDKSLMTFATPNNIFALAEKYPDLTIDEIFIHLSQLNVDIAQAVVFLSQLFSTHIALLASMRLTHEPILTRRHLKSFGIDTLLTDKFQNLLFRIMPSIQSTDLMISHSLTSQLNSIKNVSQFIYYVDYIKQSKPRMNQPVVFENQRKRGRF